MGSKISGAHPPGNDPLPPPHPAKALGSRLPDEKKEKRDRSPVSRILSAPLRELDGHFSSRLRGTPLARDATNTRRLAGGQPIPCSVLHRAGFAVPPRLPSARWALTPPFHPYLCGRNPLRGTPSAIGGMLSAALSVRSPLSSRPSLSRGALPCGVRTFLTSDCSELRPSGERQRKITRPGPPRPRKSARSTRAPPALSPDKPPTPLTFSTFPDSIA
jgi:hypothetical protein